MVEGTLVDLVEIQRHESEADGQGGFTRTWKNVSTNVPARIMPARMVQGGEGMESRAADRESEQRSLALTLKWDAQIQPQDRVVHEGQTYEVIGVNTGSFLTARRAALRQVA